MKPMLKADAWHPLSFRENEVIYLPAWVSREACWAKHEWEVTFGQICASSRICRSYPLCQKLVWCSRYYFSYSPHVTITSENVKDAETNPTRFTRKPIKSNLLVPALSKACMMQSILFFVLTTCDDHKRECKGRWNQPHTFHEEAHKI